MAAAQERRHIELRQQRLLIKEKTEPKQLAAADQALQDGDIKLAGLIYLRLALARPPSAFSEQAKQRLAQLQQEARKELGEIDAILGDGASASSPIPTLTRVPW